MKTTTRVSNAALFVLCTIFSFLVSAAASADSPTFSKDVVRIFQDKCQSCHRPGGLAPHPLMQFSDMKGHINRIDQLVQALEMPPWKPVKGCGEFRADRSLSDDQISTIHQWVMAGAPEGNRADLPPPRQFNTDWVLGTPDLTLASEKPFVLTPDGDDEYRCFTLPYTADVDSYIVGLEVKPDKATVVHHGIVYLDPKGSSVKLKDPKDPQPGYTCFGGAGFDDATVIGGWTPGSVPEFLPDGIGTLVPKGARLVLQIHYHRSKDTVADQTQLGVFFAKRATTHASEMDMIFDAKHLYIPAGDADYQISKEITLQSDIQVLNVLPHMHRLGKKIKLEADLPDQTHQCLIQIDDWDFDWQGSYAYKTPVMLPKGTHVRLTSHYDNSAGNPHQFNKPPKDVQWGERTVDEMFLAFFSFIYP
jgi:hypothetical protein